MNKRHEINMANAAMNSKQQELDRKNKAMERHIRRLSHDLSSRAAELATELQGFEEVDQKLKFEERIFDLLSDSMKFSDIHKKNQMIDSNNNQNQEKYKENTVLLEKLKREKKRIRRKI